MDTSCAGVSTVYSIRVSIARPVAVGRLCQDATILPKLSGNSVFRAPYGAPAGQCAMDRSKRLFSATGLGFRTVSFGWNQRACHCCINPTVFLDSEKTTVLWFLSRAKIPTVFWLRRACRSGHGAKAIAVEVFSRDCQSLLLCYVNVKSVYRWLDVKERL